MELMSLETSLAVILSFAFVHTMLSIYCIWRIKTINFWLGIQAINLMFLGVLYSLQIAVPGFFILVQVMMLGTTGATLQQYIRMVKERGGKEPPEPPLPD